MRPFIEIAKYAIKLEGVPRPNPMDGGMFGLRVASTGIAMKVIASWGMGWDHVSVSPIGPKRCPTWDEMETVRRAFFKPDETVIQIHPPLDEYVNTHPFCLHLWRPHDATVPRPPQILVG